MFETKFVEKIKTHTSCSITFFPENRAAYKITWKNILQPNRPQMTIWRMRIACWIRNATNTHSEFSNITYCFPTAILRYTYIACRVGEFCVYFCLSQIFCV